MAGDISWRRGLVVWGLSIAACAVPTAAVAQLPGAPTGVTGTPGNGFVRVSFTPPSDTGGSPITSYAVTASPVNPGPPVEGAASPITVYSLTNGTAYRFTVTARNGSGTGPASAASAPVTPVAVSTPTDAQVTLTLGGVTLSSYSPVTISPLENSSNIYVVARNSGTRPATLQLTSWADIVSTKPAWIFQVGKFFGFESANAPAEIALAPGESRTLGFYVSKDVNCGAVCGVSGTQAQTILPFRFKVSDSGEQGTLPITVIGNDDINNFFTNKSAAIVGRVVGSDAKPISGALVTASDFNANPVGATLTGVAGEIGRYTTRTDADGRYRLDVMSVDDMRTTLGARSVAYRSIDYFVTAEADGFAFSYRPGVAPASSQSVTVDFSLQAVQARSYGQVGQLATNGTLAYWWVRFAGNNDRVVAVEGQHPPVTEQTPGRVHVVGADLTGRELWRVPTNGQCWGMDVSPDGSLVAAGCDDHYTYIIATADGRLLQKVLTGDRPGGGQVNDVRFSPDGKLLLADGGGGSDGVSLLEVATGRVVWRSSSQTAAGEEVQRDYKSRWSPDGTRFVVGDGGRVRTYTSSGAELWRGSMGESPLWLEMDSDYNVYGAGKTRQLFAWDRDGRERWSYRLSHTANEAWNGITSDGSLLLIPSFDGQLQAFTSQGDVAWQHLLPILQMNPPVNGQANFIYGTGHNALTMTPSGSLLVQGSRGWQVLVYDRTGTLLWSHTASQRADFAGDDPDSHGHQSGVTSVAITADGTYIAAGYADSVIRIFRASK